MLRLNFILLKKQPFFQNAKYHCIYKLTILVANQMQCCRLATYVRSLTVMGPAIPQGIKNIKNSLTFPLIIILFLNKCW